MTDYTPLEYLSDDGLTLFARDYHAPEDAPVVLCLHGLTRNSADFEPLCAALNKHYRLIVPDQRGRGRSQWDHSPENYHPLRYNLDMLTLLQRLSIERVHLIGTSMGGIMGMLLAAEHPGLIASMVLNDIGPEINLEGVRLIAQMVSHPPRYSDWQHAASTLQQTSSMLFPDFSQQAWQDFARRTCRETADGIVPDYDPGIGQVFANAGDDAAPDLWPAFNQLQSLPLLVIRGAMSNILSAATCARMQAIHSGLSVVELSNRGHAPILDEPDALQAIQAFLRTHT